MRDRRHKMLCPDIGCEGMKIWGKGIVEAECKRKYNEDGNLVITETCEKCGSQYIFTKIGEGDKEEDWIREYVVNGTRHKGSPSLIINNDY